MAKDKPKDRAKREKGEKAGKATSPVVSPKEASGGQHHAAKAHGRPMRVDESLPGTREELMALHAEARRKRGSAPLGSDAYRAAAEEVGRIEIRIAAVDRAADPPRG